MEFEDHPRRSAEALDSKDFAGKRDSRLVRRTTPNGRRNPWSREWVWGEQVHRRWWLQRSGGLGCHRFLLLRGEMPTVEGDYTMEAESLELGSKGSSDELQQEKER